MHHRRPRQWACLVAFGGMLIGFALFVSTLVLGQNTWAYLGAVLLAPSILVLVLFVVPSFALRREYGLLGSKQLRDLPETMPDEPWITTSGKIGRRYHANLCLPVIVGQPGIGLTLISGDRVFIARDSIDCIVPLNSWWVRIEHSDDQLHSPITLWTLLSLGNDLRRLFPEKFAGKQALVSIKRDAK
jgi:hypothetical protein